MVALLAALLWGIPVIYLALEGVWLNSVVKEQDTASFYDWAVSEISLKNPGNSALVLIENGEVTQQYFASA